MQEWFKEKDLLEIDNQCGVQGKRKSMTIKPEEKEKTRKFRLEIFTSDDEERVNAYSKDIAKLMNECFEIEKYRIPKNDNTWIVVFSKKKVVATLIFDNNAAIQNVCVAKNYRREGIGKEAIKQAMDYICAKLKKQPVLTIDNKEKNAKKLIRMYTTFGLEVSEVTDKHTIIKFSCN
jgi:ribosomal protein S18 acetylase RimI-like enzyme